MKLKLRYTILLEISDHGKVNMYSQLDNNVMQFMLDKINKIKDYFIAENRERETTSKALSEYILDYVDKTLLVFICNK